MPSPSIHTANGTRVTTNHPPASPRALAPSDHLRGSSASPLALNRDSPISVTLKSLRLSSITYRISTNRDTRSAMPKPLPFEAWNSYRSTSTLPTVATYDLPQHLESPRPSSVMRPTPTHHATPVTRAGDTRTRAGRYAIALPSLVTPPPTTGPSPRRNPSLKTSLSHTTAPTSRPSNSRTPLTEAITGELRRLTDKPFSNASRTRLPPYLPTSASDAPFQQRRRRTSCSTPHTPACKRLVLSSLNSTTPDTYRSA